MTLSDIAKAIGIEKFDALPEGMFRYYPIPEERKGELCSIEMIERLQERFDFFGEYFELAKEYWRATEKEEWIKTYVDVASLFMKDGELSDVRKIKTLDPANSPVSDFFPLFIHLPCVEKAYEGYLARGFSQEDAKGYMRSYYNHVAVIHKEVLGRPALSRGYFSWLCLYTKGQIFSTGGFNFEIHPFGKNAVAIRNKKDGTLLPLCPGKAVHRSGNILGSAGAEDEEGSFVGTFEETEDAYVGYPAVGGLYQNEKKTFPKSDWEMAIRAGDACIDVHIPKNCDISDEAFSAALESAKECVKKGYPEWPVKMFNCASWLLSIELDSMLKPDSKILSFAHRFVRYPIKDAGRSVISFVYPKSFKGPWEELPENTSLQRAIKKRYVNGKFVYMYGGLIEL